MSILTVILSYYQIHIVIVTILLGTISLLLRIYTFSKNHKNVPNIKILYGSRTGHSKMFSELFSKLCNQHKLSHTLLNIKDQDPEIISSNPFISIYIIFISSYENDTPPESASWFYRWLEDNANDFRVSKDSLSNVAYAIFGLCDSAFEKNQFNNVAKNIDQWLESLSAKRLCHVGIGDQQSDRLAIFNTWSASLLETLKNPNIQHIPNPETILFESSEDENIEEELLDLEDLNQMNTNSESLPNPNESVTIYSRTKKTQDLDFSKFKKKPIITDKPMVTPELRQALTKQGYRVLGSHSGVKLCRWTKSMLRNRGGCYKHTFYGIESHRCMETTPSLACANKCVFCWRHNTNPVGTQWKWQVDQPDVLVQSAIENHYKMIKEMNGLPGADPLKVQEASKIRHCALSLVGEPIMYPYINDLIRMLHQQSISTFLVTNAQFPDLVATLSPVTQLYISVDASTEESLKSIDRPLFSDYWERFIASMRALSIKRQRTVYRLTLVKGYNVECIKEYADLIKIGMPDFVEVKGVTYCGNGPTTTPNNTQDTALRMSNVPFHHEVIQFCKDLCSHLEEYDLACEHAHSCCILISHKKFYYDNESSPQWHTWIDYDKFIALQKEYNESGKIFEALDYASKTPEWAIFGSDPHGFDPKETRYFRKKKCECKTNDHQCKSKAVIDENHYAEQGC